MKKKKVMIWMIAVVFLSGCWDRVEINDLAMVSAVGVDLTRDNKLLVSLQLAIPTKLSTGQNGGTASGKSTFIVSDIGETISEAYRRIQLKIPRKIFFAQSRVLLLGEDFAKKGVEPALDFHFRFQETRINSFIMVTNGKAADILKSEPKFERVPAEETKELVKLGVGLSVMVREFQNTLHEEGHEPVAPRFDLEPLEVQTKSSNGKMQEINGAAVFKQDKLIGWMDEKEARGIIWIRNKMKEAVITIQIPEDRGGGKITTDIYHARSKLDPVMENGKLKMNIIVDVVLGVMENDSPMVLDNTKDMELLNRLIEKEIKDRIYLVLDKAQKKYQSDIFGFGLEVYRKYPKQWNHSLKENWDQEFSQLEVSVQPNVHVRRIGLSKK